MSDSDRTPQPPPAEPPAPRRSPAGVLLSSLAIAVVIVTVVLALGYGLFIAGALVAFSGYGSNK